MLREDPSIIIKEVMVVWDREDYLREANNQLSDKDVYQQVKGEVEGPFMKFMKNVPRNIRNKGNISFYF